jgi:NADPH2:quinone reductase
MVVSDEPDHDKRKAREMRVVQVNEFGGPEVLQVTQVPDPVPGPDEVLIDVAVIDTLLLETDIRAGRGAEDFGITLPYVPGAAVAGTVSALGDSVAPGLLGTRVVALTPDIVGGYAERITVPADVPVRVPDAMTDLTTAAALANDGATAMDLFQAANIRQGQWVLVVGATGGVGALLVQLARNAGARVIAAARGARKLELARELGATTVVDYSAPDWVAQARAATGGAPVVLDGVGGDIGTAAFHVTADGGQFSAHGAPPRGSAAAIDPAEASLRGITLRGVQDLKQDLNQRANLLRSVLGEAVANRLRPLVGQTFPLERAEDAHTAMESRTVTGKTLLIP